HGFTLCLDYILDGLPYILVFPEPSRASVPRPAPSIRSVPTQAVQLPAAVRFEFVPDPFGPNLGLQPWYRPCCCSATSTAAPLPTRLWRRPPSLTHRRAGVRRSPRR